MPLTIRARPLAATASAQLAVFNGLNAAGLNPGDNGTFQTSPPDTTGSIGPNYYVEMVNSTIGVYSRSTLAPVARAYFNTWLGFALPNAGGPDLCDPQMQWDPSSGRWLFVVLECDLPDDAFLFGWSKTSDPSTLSTSGWCAFTRATPGLIEDYPKLGHNSNYMIIVGNAYNNTTLNFANAQLVWTPTPASGVTSTCSAPAVSIRTGLTNADATQTFTPVPVNTTPNAANGYVISAHDPSGPPPTTQSKLETFHIDSSGVFHADGAVTVGSYTIPNAAPNLGGSSFNIDTLDGRLTMAVGDPVTGMYTQHTVGDPTGANPRSYMVWYELSAVASSSTLTQQGIISSGTDYVFNGSIVPRGDGKGAVAIYNRSSATIDPVLAAQTRLSGTVAGAMETGELVLATSAAGDNDFSCNYNNSGAPCRWGDYSGASPDPNNPAVVWGSGQWLTSPSTSSPNWTTSNFGLLVGLRGSVTQVSSAPAPGGRPPVNQAPPGTPGPRP
jgi:hypothetical protein